MEPRIPSCRGLASLVAVSAVSVADRAFSNNWFVKSKEENLPSSYRLKLGLCLA